MDRTQKVAAVERMNRDFQEFPHVLLATFSGLTVNQANALRSKIREVGGRYSVIKNRLAKRAAEGTPVESLAEQFSGPCAIALHDENPVVLAKALAEFSKENPQVKLLAGLVDSKDFIDPAGVKQLATMPGLPELRAQLLALIQTPATSLVRLLNTPGGQIARVLDARREDQDGGSEAE